MEFLLNTSDPFIILVDTLIVAGLIFFGRKVENTIPNIVLMVCIVMLLVYHSVTLAGLEAGSELVSQTYHCIAFDLIMMLLAFISYLWIDDIVAKKKKLKSYDDSLSWFWNKI